jgi:hypothetical protein
MSNTAETNDETPQTLVPVDQISPFFLTTGAHQRVHDGKPDDYLPKAALPYLLMETRFGIDPSEKEEWGEALIKAVGSRDQECPYCGDSQRVERRCIGSVTGSFSYESTHTVLLD